jgi:ribosomal protein S18 acetylase RimI-like enzyme
VVTVRRARPDDEAALRPVDLATWTSAVSPSPTTDPSAPFFEPATSVEDVLVAEVEGVVAGYVRHQSGPLPSHAHVLTVNGPAVAPELQGAGVGRALLFAALEEAGARGARKVPLRVLAPDVRARPLYEACGFVEEGVLREEFLLDGRLVEDVLLARAVDGGAAAGQERRRPRGCAGTGAAAAPHARATCSSPWSPTPATIRARGTSRTAQMRARLPTRPRGRTRRHRSTAPLAASSGTLVAGVVTGVVLTAGTHPEHDGEAVVACRQAVEAELDVPRSADRLGVPVARVTVVRPLSATSSRAALSPPVTAAPWSSAAPSRTSRVRTLRSVSPRSSSPEKRAQSVRSVDGP